MPRNPNRTSEGQQPLTRDETRALDSMQSGHVRTQHDRATYRGIKNPAHGTPQGMEIPGTDGSPGISGALAPHHILGLATWRSLTEGMSPEQINELQVLLNEAGLGMGDDGDYNITGVPQDPGSRGKNPLTGYHQVAHDKERELLKKMGFTKKGGKFMIHGQDWGAMDFEAKKGILLNYGMQSEMDLDDTLRQSNQAINEQPQEFQDEYRNRVKEKGKKVRPSRGTGDYAPTRESGAVLSPEIRGQQTPQIQAAIDNAEQNLITRQGRQYGRNPKLPGLKYLPLVPLALAANDVTRQVKAGQYGEAAFTAVNAGIGEIPVVGDTVSETLTGSPAAAADMSYPDYIAQRKAEDEARANYEPQAPNRAARNTLRGLRKDQEDPSNP